MYWEVRHGKATYIDNTLWVKLHVKLVNADDTLTTKKTFVIKSDSDGSTWAKGSKNYNSTALTYTFPAAGTYKIYLDGESSSPNYDTALMQVVVE